MLAIRYLCSQSYVDAVNRIIQQYDDKSQQNNDHYHNMIVLTNLIIYHIMEHTLCGQTCALVPSG